MGLENRLDTPLAKAVRAAGSQSAFGRIIGRPQPTIHGWLKAGHPLDGDYVLTVEAKIGISRHELRPDLYPIEQPPPAHKRGMDSVKPAVDPSPVLRFGDKVR